MASMGGQIGQRTTGHQMLDQFMFKARCPIFAAGPKVQSLEGRFRPADTHRIAAKFIGCKSLPQVSIFAGFEKAVIQFPPR